MISLVDTSVIIDVLRGHEEARRCVVAARHAGPLHASEITRLEVLAGMRPREAVATNAVLGVFVWHPVDRVIAERAGALGREWLPAFHTIDAADLAIAATAEHVGAQLLTRNVKHFPMFDSLTAPY